MRKKMTSNNKESAQTQTPKTTKKLNNLEAKKPAEPRNRSQGLTVVGIGASAGGLSALGSFFDALSPDTGMAFVVVTHLHPKYESHLAELLQQHTQMSTRQVTRRTKVEANHVYVIPPTRNLTTAGGSSNSRMNLNVEVEEEPTGSISFGAGYSSVDSLVGMIQLSQENFRGKGQRFDVSAQLGGSNQFRFSFTEPWFRDTRWSAGFDLYNMERWYEDFDSESSGGNVRFGHPIGEYTRINFGYEYVTVDISDVDADAAIEILEQEGSTTVGAITSGITLTTLDSRFTPRKGSLTSLMGKFAGVGGDNSFVTLEASSSRFFPLPWDTAFMIRGTIGYIFGYGGSIVRRFRLERPRFFFGLIGAVLAVLAVVLAVPLAITYVQTGLVPRLPTAILVTGLGVLASLSLTCGLILENVTRGRQEARRLVYLGIPGCASLSSATPQCGRGPE